MFAWKLPAWTRTFKSNVYEIYLCLVRFAATTLAFAPKCEVVCSFTYPFSRIRQVFPGFFRRFVRRKDKYLIFSKIQKVFFVK